jgi:hypothetical protein
MGSLTNRKREAFAREIAAMTPYGKAYAEAGYGGNPRWHEYNARKLAQQPEVRARIEELRTEFTQMAGIHAEYIQRQILPLVEANPKDLYNADGSLRPIAELPRALAKAIRTIKHDAETGRVVEIALYNPTEAGNILLRSIGVIREAEINIKNNNVQIDTVRQILDSIDGKTRGLPSLPQPVAEIESVS